MSLEFSSFFEKVFVINLDSKPDRWESVSRRLSEYGFKNIERVSACCPDIATINDDDIRDLNYGPDRMSISDFAIYKKHAVGCRQSHRKVLDRAIDDGLVNYLVFEDDVVFKNNTQDKLNELLTELSNVKWDMFYLGGNHRSKRKAKKMSSNLKRLYCTYETHAYAVDQGFYKDLAVELACCKAEIDHFYAEKIHPRYKCYAPLEDLAFQDNPTVLKSDVGETNKVSRKGIFDKIRSYFS